MARHGSLAEQLSAALSAPPAPRKAANDNKPKETRYSGALPALRWLWENRPDIAHAFASALPRPVANWFVEIEPTRQEIRPTIGEVLAASLTDGEQATATHETNGTYCYTTLGSLKFRNGMLVEWGTTRKGRKLKPADRARPTGDQANKTRNPASYLALRGPKPSMMAADHYHRPFSGEDAISSMYDPLPGVEAARALLVSLGVDGSVRADQLPHAVTHCQKGVAAGAGFLGGVTNSSGNSSSGAVMWEGPEDRPSDAKAVIEEVAARGTLKSIGLRLGYSEEYADRAGRTALIDVAETLTKMRERKKSA